MSFYVYTCEDCQTNIEKIVRSNMVQRYGREIFLCNSCLNHSKSKTPSLSLEGTAYEDLFQMDEFSRLKEDILERLSKEQLEDGFQRDEEHDTTTQYKYKEKAQESSFSDIDTEPPIEKPSLEEAIAKLEALVGLPSIKKNINDLITSFEGQKKLYEVANGTIKMEKPTLHMSFTGADGTGKREVAKILTEILFASGHIKENKYIEVDRSSLVGEHVGSTSPKVISQIKKALGGVLFIQDANTLVSENGKDFGREAITTLSKEMETHRDNLVVILAGVESEMNHMFQQYPALSSRISSRFRFQDYTPKQLASMTQKMLEDRGYSCTDVLEDIETSVKKSSRNGSVEGNGRWVRNFVQKIVQQHVIRYSEDEPEEFDIISKEDVIKALSSKDTHEQEGLSNVKETALNELRQLIGLTDLKDEVKRIMNFFTVSKRKFEKGISSSKPTMHMVFAGPPGTGKTTVAKIMAQFLKGEGILANGHLKEVSRADLVGAHVGETALKVKKIIQESLGGILFIDEAYSLDGGDKDSFGQEAIDTLIKEMEENRENLIVILAGYDNDMKRLLEKNAGFTSRVAYQFEFPNYSTEEIMQIIDLSIQKNSIVLNEETISFLRDKVHELAEESDGIIHGNGRWVRNFMDKLEIAQSNRIVEENSDDLLSITKDDIANALLYLEKF